MKAMFGDGIMGAMHDAGVASHAVVSHPHASIDAQHMTLVEEGPDDRFSLTSAQVTREGLEALGRMQASEGRAFLFLHYIDAHMYYVPNPLFEYGVGRWSAYLEEVSFVDYWLGEFLSAIHEDDSVAVLLMSDHGEEFWEHHATQHGQRVYDESSLLVFGARLPGSRGRVLSGARRIDDMDETLAELFGLGGFDGSSLLDPVDSDEVVVLKGQDSVAAVSRRQKVIYNRDSGVWERYVFEEDAGEHDNVIAGASGAEDVRHVCAVRRALER
jgi:membrane-anchored protein YejM (alkaline phosphatase superfamily)